MSMTKIKQVLYKKSAHCDVFIHTHVVLSYVWIQGICYSLVVSNREKDCHVLSRIVIGYRSRIYTGL